MTRRKIRYGQIFALAQTDRHRSITLPLGNRSARQANINYMRGSIPLLKNDQSNKSGFTSVACKLKVPFSLSFLYSIPPTSLTQRIKAIRPLLIAIATLLRTFYSTSQHTRWHLKSERNNDALLHIHTQSNVILESRKIPLTS